MRTDAWPFLVAAGRRREYTTVLAPDFLVAQQDYGILEQVARPGDGSPTVLGVTSRRGYRLGVVLATHTVTADDIGAPPRDEHSRPLRFIYGFVTLDRWVTRPADTDLDTAKEAALTAYRRFLADEEAFVVQPAGAFPVRSVVAAPAPNPPTQRGGRTVRLGIVAVLCAVAVAVALAVLLRPRPAGGPAVCPSSPSASPAPSCPARSP